MRISGMTVACVALGLAILGVGMAQDDARTYVKGMMCIACHKALNKDLVARYQTTKHSKVKLEDDMKPVDIYRRVVGFRSADNSYYESGIGCQDCHGPGSAHLKARAKEDKAKTMIQMSELKTQHQKLSVCGRCHGTYTVGDKPFAEDFLVGDDKKGDLFKLEGFKLAEITESTPFTKLNEFMQSKHAENDIHCATCHTAHEDMAGEHQTRKAVPDLCLDCHANEHQCTVTEAPEGATCVTCHMADGSHTFEAKQP